MATYVPRSTFVPLALLLVLLPLSAATGIKPRGRIDSGQCPDNLESLVHSPFTPYFHWMHGNAQKCWDIADCLFEAAQESRKQQFAAIALIMGLIPLTLKDIAWPEKRIVYVTKPLPWIVEVLVLALGLEPEEAGEKEPSGETDEVVRGWNEAREKNMASTSVAKVVWSWSRSTILLVIGATAAILIGCYAGLVIMEVYSKRSALGCPVPIFIATWHVIALLPASIHALFASFRRRRFTKSKPLLRQAERDQQIQGVSTIPGGDQAWPVQMAWAIYYIAGTLVYTSIMAVTVPELVCWVLLGLTVTACSKLLAFFLCLVFEKRGWDTRKA